MTGSGCISWHRVTENVDVKKLLDGIADEINTTGPMASGGTIRQLPKEILRHGKDKLLYLLIGYLIAKIEGPGRRLGPCRLEDSGEFYATWTVD